MDHCLRIPEVVDYICLALSGRNALSMGLAHKTFLEPALDSLWRQINSFKPLMSCLPSDLLSVEVRGNTWDTGGQVQFYVSLLFQATHCLIIIL